MADHPKRGRNRPDSSQMWDESDRRSNHARHDRNDATARSRNDRAAARADDHPRGHNRSRSRSPRRDRDRDRDRRDRSRDRERDYDRRHRGSDRHGRAEGRDGRNDERRHRDARGDGGRDDRRQGKRYDGSLSPRSPPRGKDTPASEYNSSLPSRPKADRAGGKGSSSSTPLSFRVGSQVPKGGSSKDHDVQDSGDGGRDHDDRNRSGSAYAEERRSRSPGRRERDQRQDEDAMDEDRRDDADDDDDDDGDIVEDDGGMDMAAMMGFGGFGSTKGKKVTGNNAYYVRKEKKTEYRQYMNRVGGFNRPLSPTRD